MAGFLRVVAQGKRDAVGKVLAFAPAVADIAGPHPYWGGQPTAVTLAAEWGRTDVLRDLLAAGAHPDAPSAKYDGWTPLMCAIWRGHEDAVRVLREAGARVDVWAAAALGDTDRIRQLVDADPSLVSARGPNRATPLHFAATADVARLLVARGSDRAALDQYGSTPVRVAAHAGLRRREAARYLASLEDDIDFFTLVALGDVERVAQCLDGEPSLLQKRATSAPGSAAPRRSSALHIAAAHGDAAMAIMLLERGSDVDSLADNGESPMHHAARAGSVDVVRILIEHGARTDLRDEMHDATPEAWAGFFEQDAVARFLQARRYAP